MARGCLVIIGIAGGLLLLILVIGFGASLVSPNPSPSVAKTETGPTAKPTPPPIKDPVELRKRAEEFVKMPRERIEWDRLAEMDSISKQLKTGPSDAKTKALVAQLDKLIVSVAAEEAVMGERPSKGDMYVAFNRYFRDKLHDYDSSEYVDYTEASKVYVKNEPFWATSLKLRAKNRFGAFVLDEYTVYLRNKSVLLAVKSD